MNVATSFRDPYSFILLSMLVRCGRCALFVTCFCVVSNGKGEPSQQGFGMGLLKALLDNMPYLPAAATGGKYN